jgi:GntR family transcriptional regulator, rspAB operon transcriptional repressor
MPGDFLAEVQLARECKTSRTPIREACNRLSQEGWIARIPRKGYLVPPISVRDLVEIYEYRKLLECFTAEKVAQTASSEQIAEIAQIIEVERRPSRTIAEILEANERFHIGICGDCRKSTRARSAEAYAGVRTPARHLVDAAGTGVCAARGYRICAGSTTAGACS